ncbi:hypothetical protein BDZ89DRAFT_1035486 [Hymenopellis radicata]|nr:hypothetical protein BDZ89DRAFT_1035486 [Hymenopellis radicata]
MAHQQILTSTLTERLMLRTDKTNYASFKIHVEEYIAGKGYLDASISQPPIVPVTTGSPAPTPTPVYSTTPSRDEWNYRNGVAKSIIITNIIDPIAIGLKRDGTAAEVWERLEKICLPKSDAALSLAEEQLNETKFTGTSRVELDEHIANVHAKAARLQSLGKVLPDKDLKNTIARSLPKTPEWFGISGSLYAALSSEDVIALIQAHAIHIGLPEEPTLGRGVNANAYTAASGGGAGARRSCTNPNCKARDRSGHWIADCYWPGGGKEGQFPPNFGRREQPQPGPQANQVIYPSVSQANQSLYDYPSISHRALAAQSNTIEDGQITVRFVDEAQVDEIMPPLEDIDVGVESACGREGREMEEKLDPPSFGLVMVDLLAPLPGSANPFMLVMQDGSASKSYALLDDTRESMMIQAFDDYRRQVERSSMGHRISEVYADGIFKSRQWEEYFSTHNITHLFSPHMASADTTNQGHNSQDIVGVDSKATEKRTRCGVCVETHTRVEC